jgi:hypothetical protein
LHFQSNNSDQFVFWGGQQSFWRKGEERSFYQLGGQPEENVRRLYSLARGRKPSVTASGGRIALLPLRTVNASDVPGKEEDFENRLLLQREARHAEIFLVSRVCVNISLNGASRRPDMDDNGELYGGRPDNKAIENGGIASPTVASNLISVLTK